MKPYRIDCHLHTKFSPDSFVEPSDLLRVAHENDMDYVIFTEHSECNWEEISPPEAPAWTPLNVEAYTSALEELKDSSPVNFGIGVEIGQATQKESEMRKTMSAYNWDFVIASLHNIENEYDFYYLDYEHIDTTKLLKRYFEELYKLAGMDFYSVLGHIYYPFRYMPDQQPEKWDAEVADVMRVAIARGKGLEVNTKIRSAPSATIRTEFTNKTPMPDTRALKLYKSLGGEIVTVGSDSHDCCPGRDVDIAYEMLREAGFNAVARFSRMAPQMKDI